MPITIITKKTSAIDRVRGAQKEIDIVKSRVQTFKGEVKDPEHPYFYGNIKATGMGIKDRMEGRKEIVAISGKEKDRVLAEVKSIEEKIKKDIQSKEEMKIDKGGNVNRFLKWEKTHRDDIFKWKQGMKALEPDKPAIVDNLRPEK